MNQSVFLESYIIDRKVLLSPGTCYCVYLAPLSYEIAYCTPKICKTGLLTLPYEAPIRVHGIWHFPETAIQDTSSLYK